MKLPAAPSSCSRPSSSANINQPPAINGPHFRSSCPEAWATMTQVLAFSLDGFRPSLEATRNQPPLAACTIQISSFRHRVIGHARSRPECPVMSSPVLATPRGRWLAGQTPFERFVALALAHPDLGSRNPCPLNGKPSSGSLGPIEP